MMERWVDKWEPKTLDEIVGQKTLVETFKSYVKNNYIPDMTLSGSPGIGKTLIVKCFIQDLYKMPLEELIKSGIFVPLNASDDRGIDVVRTTIKSFAQKPSLFKTQRLIFLDEGDSITKDAQAALRALIADCGHNARFIIACNYPNALLEPIISRCPIKEVHPLTKEDVTIMINRIKEKEKFTITQDAIDYLFEICKGDMRLMINKLQDACLISNFAIQKPHIISTNVTLDFAKKIIEISKTNFEQAREMVIVTYSESKDARAIVQKLYEATYHISLSDKMPDNEIMQRRLREKIADTDFRLTQGTNALIQLDSVLNYIRLMNYLPLNCPKVK